MIINSRARKDPSFSQLVGYINRENTCDQDLIITNNLLCDPYDQAAVIRTFDRNATYLKNAPGINYLYHEVITLAAPQSGQSFKHQQKALQDLVLRYIKQRAPKQIAYARIHTNTKYQHAHIIISANARRGRQREWLSRSDFGDIQAEIEQHRLEHFPELGNTRYYTKAREPEKVKLTDREQSLITREKCPSKKQQMSTTLNSIFDTTHTQTELLERLKTAGLELYHRGSHDLARSVGVKRGHRLKTLGLQTKHAKLMKRLQALEKRLARHRRQVAQMEQAAQQELDGGMDRH